MTRLSTTARVGPLGKITIEVPASVAAESEEVVVTIEPIGVMRPTRTFASQEEWQQFLREVGGSIDDPTFMRHPQGEYEKRESFD